MRRCAFLLLALLLLAAGRPDTVALAPAAPVPQGATFISKTFHFNFVSPDRLCVGQKVPLRVTIVVDLEGTANSPSFKAENRVVPGITVQANTDDSSVATIAPPSLTSGALQTDLLASPPIGNANGQGEVDFSLSGKKAGLTKINLNATIPAALTGGASQTRTVSVIVAVQNCKYKVTISGNWDATYLNLKTFLTETLKGEFTRKDNGSLSGSATVNWNLRSFSALCSHQHTATAISPVNITGDQLDDTLNVTLNYAAFQLTTKNCASGTNGDIGVQILEFKGLPPQGQTIGGLIPTFQVGNEMLKGSASLTIVPIPVQ
jgi:hypothetical protein